MNNKPLPQVLMACGHFADSITTDGEPYCSLCFGETIKAFTPVSVEEGRMARCMDCGKLAKSDPKRQPFFQARPAEDTDLYACRCRPL